MWFVSCTHTFLYVCTSSCNLNCNGRRQLVALVFLAVVLVILGRQFLLARRAKAPSHAQHIHTHMHVLRPRLT
jgi:hypothetical protein